MAERARRLTLMALLLLVPFAVACGTAEQPAEAPAETPAPAAAPEPASEPEPAVQEPEVEEPAPQQGPQLVGNITLSNENFDWGPTDNETAEYTWTVRVANDTTATLDITVRFQFLDNEDQVIKTETKTVRLDPATATTLRESGRMNYKTQANRVYSFSAAFDYQIVGT